MDLVRDILDAQLVDKNGRNIGRADGIVIEIRQRRPPRVAAIASGATILARRIHPRFARWLRALAARFSPVPVRPIRISPDRLRDIGVDVELDVDADRDPKLLRVEKWLSRHVISRLPGGKA